MPDAQPPVIYLRTLFCTHHIPSHIIIYHYHHFHKQWNSSKQDALFLWKKFKISSLPSMAQLQHASMQGNLLQCHVI